MSRVHSWELLGHDDSAELAFTDPLGSLVGAVGCCRSFARAERNRAASAEHQEQPVVVNLGHPINGGTREPGMKQ